MRSTIDFVFSWPYAQAIIALLEARCYKDAQKAAREIALVAHTDKQPRVYREEMVPGVLGGEDPVGELLKTVTNVSELTPDDMVESVASFLDEAQVSMLSTGKPIMRDSGLGAIDARLRAICGMGEGHSA